MVRIPPFAALMALFGLTSATCPATSSSDWSLTRGHGVAVYSEAGSETGQATLEWFERLRAFFATQSLLPAVSAGEVTGLRAIVFRSAKEYAPYRPHPGADAYFAGYSRESFIVMPSLGPRQRAVAAHEYVHAVLHGRPGRRLPPWLDEGLCEVFSTLQLDERRSVIGLPPANHLASLQWRHTSLSTLLEAPRADFQAAHGAEGEELYAQSWALSHMLLLAPAYRGHLPELFALWEQGLSSREALERAYGRRLATIQADLYDWVQQRRPAEQVAPAVPAIADVPTAKPVSTLEVSRVLADLEFTLGDLPRAAAMYEELAKALPRDPDLPAALGKVALRQNDARRARRLWARAVELGTPDAEVCYQYGILLQDSGGPRAEVRAALERAVALRPDFDDARYQLGLLAANMGQDEEAVEQLRAMRHVDPSRAFFYWCTLADSLTVLDRREEARKAAEQAMAAAKDDEQRKRAEDLAYLAGTDLNVRLVRDAQGRTQLAMARVPHGSTGHNPFVEPTDHLRRVTAPLREVRCGSIVRMVLQPPDGPLVLAIPNPAGVLMHNAPPEFTCGPQDSAIVVSVEYADAPTDTEAGILRGMAFPDSGAAAP